MHRLGKQRTAEMSDGFCDHEGHLPESPTLQFAPRTMPSPGCEARRLPINLNAQIVRLAPRARQDMSLRGFPFVGSALVTCFHWRCFT